MIKYYVVFDLDGTLIDISSIAHLAQAQEWDEFADNSLTCPPFESMVQYALHIQKMKNIDWIVCTTKPERLRQRTLNWLHMEGLMPEHLLMRPAHDYRPTEELKLALMEECLGPDWKKKVLFAIDDRDKAIDAWRAAGITALQCAPSLY